MSTAATSRDQRSKPRHEGITVRHLNRCASNEGRRCNCDPGYQAQAYSRRDGKTLRRTFPTLAAAKAWRSEAQTAIRRGTLRGPSEVTIAAAGAALVVGMKEGTIRNRSGDPYKPSVVRQYERSIRIYVRPELGSKKLSSLTRVELQDFADRLLTTGLDPSSVKNTLIPLRVIYRRAFARSEVAINPTAGLELPASRGRRQRIADPVEAAALIEALRPEERPLWALALYSGLRRGELWALRWEDVDLEAGVIHVRRGWDMHEGEIEPKSGAGIRRVPIVSVLQTYLLEQKLRNGGRAEFRVLADENNQLRDSTTLTAKAKGRWKATELTPIGLHECRHTFASLMIAAGVNAKALSTYIGHASIAITMDRYGHLMPGSEAEAAEQLSAYLENTTRIAD
ncbi:MAG TPA: tyrosine-type recombinase/integrase [Solirubrobacterales bacterium]|nr:tyrosine-type recombinase/integrase [Solirubrobacterales bacterium]